MRHFLIAMAVVIQAIGGGGASAEPQPPSLQPPSPQQVACAGYDGVSGPISGPALARLNSFEARKSCLEALWPLYKATAGNIQKARKARDLPEAHRYQAVSHFLTASFLLLIEGYPTLKPPATDPVR